MLLKLKELKKSTNNKIMEKKVLTKRNYSVYTQKEIDIIVEELQAYPENKQHAFKMASERLINRTHSSIHMYYYNILSKKQTITTTGSAVGFTSNTKNVKRNADGNFERQEPLKPMFVILRQLLSLQPSELKKVKLILEEVC